MANNAPHTDVREEDGACLDGLLTMLSDAQRRRVLTLLVDSDAIGLDEVLRAGGHDDPTIQRTALYHNHLPKLDAAGFVDWDVDLGRIRRGPKFDDVEPVVLVLRSSVDDLPLEWL